MHTDRSAPRNRTSTSGEVETARAFTEPVRTGQHQLVLFPDMSTMLRTVATDSAAAVERIWIETYIYRGDRLGRAFAETLARAVDRKLDVRLLYDPLGCNETDPAFFEMLRERGIDVRAYRPRNVSLREGTWWPRDHTRNIVIDRKSYTGGAAWGDEWLPRSSGGLGWHDVCSRVEGPCVDDFANAFEQRWAEAEGATGQTGDYATGSKYSDLELVSDTPIGPRCVFDRYRERIRNATSRVWIENSYFLPPVELLRDLYDAAARGVDVKIILPGETDLPIVHRAARAEYPNWLAHGLEIYEYCDAVLHSKYAVIDDDWATVGTFNAMVVSLLYSNELNLFVHAPEFARRVASVFERDLARSRAVVLDDLAGLSLGERVGDNVANGLLSVLEFGFSPARAAR